MFEPAQAKAKAFQLFCRVLGAVVIISGLYLVLWGKSKDDHVSAKSECDKISPSDQKMIGKDESLKMVQPNDEFVVLHLPQEEKH